MALPPPTSSTRTNSSVGGQTPSLSSLGTSVRHRGCPLATGSIRNRGSRHTGASACPGSPRSGPVFASRLRSSETPEEIGRPEGRTQPPPLKTSPGSGIAPPVGGTAPWGICGRSSILVHHQEAHGPIRQPLPWPRAPNRRGCGPARTTTPTPPAEHRLAATGCRRSIPRMPSQRGPRPRSDLARTSCPSPASPSRWLRPRPTPILGRAWSRCGTQQASPSDSAPKPAPGASGPALSRLDRNPPSAVPAGEMERGRQPCMRHSRSLGGLTGNTRRSIRSTTRPVHDQQ